MNISIALCTYNGEKYLEQQLNSYVSQTLKPHELVVCDDGSSDGTLQVLNEFKSRAYFDVRIFNNEVTLGAVKNFEKSIGLCSGEIILLSDQDDVWVNTKVEKIHNYFQTNTGCEAIFTDGILINGKKELLNKTLWEQYNFSPAVQLKWKSGGAFKDLLYNRNRMTGATMAIRRSLYNKSIPFQVPKGFYQDLWLGLHASANNSLGWISEKLILYRVHDQQVIGVGQGTSINGSNTSTPSLELVLSGIKEHYEKCLAMSKIFFEKYPALQKNSLTQEAIDAFKWVHFRTYLPKNHFSRLIKICSNYSLYRKHSSGFIRSMARDIIRPARIVI